MEDLREDGLLVKKVLDFTSTLFNTHTYFYINIKTSNGLCFELDTTKPDGKPNMIGDSVNGKKRKILSPNPKKEAKNNKNMLSSIFTFPYEH